MPCVHLNIKFQMCSSASVAECLVQLQVLNIYNCQAMQVIIWSEGPDDVIKFPQLKFMDLQRMPTLASCYSHQRIMDTTDISYVLPPCLFSEMVCLLFFMPFFITELAVTSFSFLYMNLSFILSYLGNSR